MMKVHVRGGVIQETQMNDIIDDQDRPRLMGAYQPTKDLKGASITSDNRGNLIAIRAVHGCTSKHLATNFAHRQMFETDYDRPSYAVYPCTEREAFSSRAFPFGIDAYGIANPKTTTYSERRGVKATKAEMDATPTSDITLFDCCCENWNKHNMDMVAPADILYIVDVEKLMGYGARFSVTEELLASRRLLTPGMRKGGGIPRDCIIGAYDRWSQKYE
jgi:hypothetical protein